MKLWIRISAYLIPYAAVGIGLYIFKSAWLAILLYHAGIIVFLAIVKPKYLVKRIFSGWEIKTAVFSILICSLAGVVFYELHRHLHIFIYDLEFSLDQMGLKDSYWFLFCAYFVIVHPFLEEMFWREALRNSRKLLSIEDLAFAGYHVLVLMFFIEPTYVVLAFVVLAFSSWYWRTAANRLDGLIIPVVSHTVADLSVIIVANYLLSLNVIFD